MNRQSLDLRVLLLAAMCVLAVSCVEDSKNLVLTNPEAPLVASTSSATLPSATGSGNTLVLGQLRTFSFTARQDADGTAHGTAVINNRAVGEMFQLDIDCLKVVGNVAIMSGTITRHTDVHAVGLTGVFGVVDAGEGAGAASDAASQVFFFRPGTVTCQDIDPAESAGLAVPIVSGNVQVRPGSSGS